MEDVPDVDHLGPDLQINRYIRGTRDLRAVQTLLGHASPATTATYTQLVDEQLTAAVLAAS